MMLNLMLFMVYWMVLGFVDMVMVWYCSFFRSFFIIMWEMGWLLYIKMLRVWKIGMFLFVVIYDMCFEFWCCCWILSSVLVLLFLLFEDDGDMLNIWLWWFLWVVVKKRFVVIGLFFCEFIVNEWECLLMEFLLCLGVDIRWFGIGFDGDESGSGGNFFLWFFIGDGEVVILVVVFCRLGGMWGRLKKFFGCSEFVVVEGCDVFEFVEVLCLFLFWFVIKEINRGDEGWEVWLGDELVWFRLEGDWGCWVVLVLDSVCWIGLVMMGLFLRFVLVEVMLLLFVLLGLMGLFEFVRVFVCSFWIIFLFVFLRIGRFLKVKFLKLLVVIGLLSFWLFLWFLMCGGMCRGIKLCFMELIWDLIWDRVLCGWLKLLERGLLGGGEFWFFIFFIKDWSVVLWELKYLVFLGFFGWGINLVLFWSNVF